jgi:hypothetical protein
MCRNLTCVGRRISCNLTYVGPSLSSKQQTFPLLTTCALHLLYSVQNDDSMYVAIIFSLDCFYEFRSVQHDKFTFRENSQSLEPVLLM